MRAPVTATIVLAALSTVLAPAVARAQARTTIAPSVAVGVRYDDNVFWSPVPTSDIVWGFTPGVEALRESAHSTWLSHYSFDTERFRDHPTLTTRLARQTASSSWKVEKSSATTFAIAGGYDSTLTPSELNLTTGLGSPRLRAWRWHAGPDVRYTAGSLTKLHAAYQFTADFLETHDNILTHAVNADVARQVGARDTVQLAVILERFLFNGGEGLNSEAFVAGVSHQLTPFTTLTIGAGPRLGGGALRPEVNASLVRKAGSSELSATYDRTQTTAFGVLTLIDVQRIVGGAIYRRADTLEATAQGGLYVNTVGASRLSVYRVAAGLTKPVGAGISLSASYALDFQSGTIGASLLTPILTGPTADARLTPQVLGGHLHRNVVFFRVIVAPRLKPVREPPKGPEGAVNPGGANRSQS